MCCLIPTENYYHRRTTNVEIQTVAEVEADCIKGGGRHSASKNLMIYTTSQVKNKYSYISIYAYARHCKNSSYNIYILVYLARNDKEI